MFLDKITLLNFKNHASLSLNFEKKINCFIGKNGVGKTNIIDSIYYLCLTKSYFNSTDQQNILIGKDFFRLDGRFTKNASSGKSDYTEIAGAMEPVAVVGMSPGAATNETWHSSEAQIKYAERIGPDFAEKFEIVYKLPVNKRKELIVNNSPVPKLSDHIGSFPCIIICPDDSQLVLGSSEERRKFLDATLAQVNHDYLEWLIAYTKILAQRNAALKQFAETKKTDRHLLESYNKQLVPLGTNIYKARKALTEKLDPAFQRFYKKLSLERESVSFTYYSQLSEKSFDELLHQNFERDLMLQRTEAGIHKDDLEFYIAPKSAVLRHPADSGNPESAGKNSKMKKFGSQGQQKSFIISIKFAQYELIKQNTSSKPLLLIDDIFDKLDNDRSQKLIELIAGNEFGQIFLTDTEDGHIRDTLKNREQLFDVIEI